MRSRGLVVLEHYGEAPSVVLSPGRQLAYQRLNDGVAYVALFGMGGYADPAELAQSQDAVQTELDAVEPVLDLLLDELA